MEEKNTKWSKNNKPLHFVCETAIIFLPINLKHVPMSHCAIQMYMHLFRHNYKEVVPISRYEHLDELTQFTFFICFVALRPKPTAMVMVAILAGWSVHLTTLFSSTSLNMQLTSTSCTYFGLQLTTTIQPNLQYCPNNGQYFLEFGLSENNNNGRLSDLIKPLFGQSSGACSDFFRIFLLLLIFLQNQLFLKKIQEYHQGVKQF